MVIEKAKQTGILLYVVICFDFSCRAPDDNKEQKLKRFHQLKRLSTYIAFSMCDFCDLP